MQQADFSKTRQRLVQLAGERSSGDVFCSLPNGCKSSGTPVKGALYEHAAEGVEIALTIRGEVRVATPRQLFRLKPNQILILGRGMFHAQLASASSWGHLVSWLHLNGSDAMIGDSVWEPAGGVVSNSLRLDPALVLPGRTNVESIGSAIANELVTRDWGYHRAASSLLQYLVCILMRRLGRGAVSANRAAESPSIPVDQRRWGLLQRALEFCEANFRRPVSCAEVGRAVGYSGRYLSQLMSAQLGHTLGDHLRNLRLNEGRRLLEQSTLPIRAIGNAVGYSDPAHFSRAFSRYFGVSPRAHRSRLIAP